MNISTALAKHELLLLELFVATNFAFLTLDIYLAHSFNAFRHWAEWIPFYFSAVAAVLLVPTLVYRYRVPGSVLWRQIGFLLGGMSILVGAAGMLFHLNSVFFAESSIRNLVYTAPFAAPVAYVGVGFLLLLNRMVSTEDIEWGQWVLFFALGGFFGNFVLSLCDHAQNGFFNASEWIPVWSSAFAVGFLATAVLRPSNSNFLRLCLFVVAVQIAVGILGFGFHLVADLKGPSARLLDNFIYGAPSLAPLLFANLGILAWFGLGHLMRRGDSEQNTVG